MRTHSERIKKLIRAANRLLVSVGNEPIEIPEVAEPTYRTPTLRDLLNGPIECEVLKLGEWKKQMLLAVDAARPVFYVANSVADLTGKWTDECRIPAEPELPPEKPEWELIDGVLFYGQWRVEISEDVTAVDGSGFDLAVSDGNVSRLFLDIDKAVEWVEAEACK